MKNHLLYTLCSRATRSARKVSAFGWCSQRLFSAVPASFLPSAAGVGIGLHHILHGQLQRQRRRSVRQRRQRVLPHKGRQQLHRHRGAGALLGEQQGCRRAVRLDVQGAVQQLQTALGQQADIPLPPGTAKGSNIPAPRPDRCAGPVPARGHTAQAAQSGPLCPVRAAKAGRTRSVGRPGPAAASRSPAAKHVLPPWGTSLINNADAVF